MKRLGLNRMPTESALPMLAEADRFCTFISSARNSPAPRDTSRVSISISFSNNCPAPTSASKFCTVISFIFNCPAPRDTCTKCGVISSGRYNTILLLLISSISNLEYSGDIGAAADISCSMGNVSLDLKGDREDFNYELHCVGGNLDIDGDKYAGVDISKSIDNGTDKSIEINCSMGNVEVDF